MTTDKMFSASKIILFFCSMDNVYVSSNDPIKPNDVFNGVVNVAYYGFEFGIRITEKMRLIITFIGDKDYPATYTKQHDAVIALNEMAKNLLYNQDIITNDSKALLLSLMLSSATRR